MRLDDCFSEGLLRKYPFPPEVVHKEVQNAERHMENANRCIEDGMYDLALVSVYTAMFHAARAILFRDGVKERSHICVITYLREKYPEMERYSRIMDMYRRQRHTMLYGIDAEALEEDAREGVELAIEFLEAVRGILKI